MDIGIAVTATEGSAEETFRYMKGVIKKLIDNYGYGNRVRYGLIVFGASASTKFSFREEYGSLVELQRYVEAVPRVSGGPRMDKALDEATKLFEDESNPSAKKVFLVFTDKNSTGNQDDERAKIQGLGEKGVATIVTSLTAEVAKSFERLVPEDQIIITDPTKDPSEVVGKVIDTIDNSKLLLLVANLRYINNTLFLLLLSLLL